MSLARPSSVLSDEKEIPPSIVCTIPNIDPSKNPVLVDLSEMVNEDCPNEEDLYFYHHFSSIKDMTPVLKLYDKFKAEKEPLSGSKYYFLCVLEIQHFKRAREGASYFEKALKSQYLLAQHVVHSARIELESGHVIDDIDIKLSKPHYERMAQRSSNPKRIIYAHKQLGCYFRDAEANYVTAAYHFKQGALRGDQDCQFLLGQLYEQKIKDINQAVIYYRQAAENRAKLPDDKLNHIVFLFKEAYSHSKSTFSYAASFVVTLPLANSFVRLQLALSLVDHIDRISPDVVPELRAMLNQLAQYDPVEFAREVTVISCWEKVKLLLEREQAEKINKRILYRIVSLATPTVTGKVEEKGESKATLSDARNKDAAPYAAVLERSGGSPSVSPRASLIDSAKADELEEDDDTASLLRGARLGLHKRVLVNPNSRG